MSDTLTPETVQRLIEAQVRLAELNGNSAIINPRSEAEITGLKKFIGETMTAHSSEFIGNWVAIQQEYSPLIEVLEKLFNRVAVRNAQRVQQRQPTAPANE